MAIELENYLPATLTPPGPMTDEEFISFCEQYPVEQIEMTAEGEILIMPPAGFFTSFQNSQISAQLSIWADRHAAGAATDSSGLCVLPNGARRTPDAAWTSWSRLEALGPQGLRGFARIAPDFIIELRSATDRLPRLRRKMQEWIDNGPQLAWLVDPERRVVEIYRPGSEPQILEEAQSVSGEGPVDGFILDLNAVWKQR